VPALEYFTDHGVDIDATILPKSVVSTSKENLMGLFERCSMNRTENLEKMREDIHEMLIEMSQDDNYMVNIYGA
jgi:hypothetical protein